MAIHLYVWLFVCLNFLCMNEISFTITHLDPKAWPQVYLLLPTYTGCPAFLSVTDLLKPSEMSHTHQSPASPCEIYIDGKCVRMGATTAWHLSAHSMEDFSTREWSQHCVFS